MWRVRYGGEQVAEFLFRFVKSQKISSFAYSLRLNPKVLCCKYGMFDDLMPGFKLCLVEVLYIKSAAATSLEFLACYSRGA